MYILKLLAVIYVIQYTTIKEKNEINKMQCKNKINLCKLKVIKKTQS